MLYGIFSDIPLMWRRGIGSERFEWNCSIKLRLWDLCFRRFRQLRPISLLPTFPSFILPFFGLFSIENRRLLMCGAWRIALISFSTWGFVRGYYSAQNRTRRELSGQTLAIIAKMESEAQRRGVLSESGRATDESLDISLVLKEPSKPHRICE